MLKTTIYKIIREVQFSGPIRKYFFPRYQYQFTPPQLCFLTRCIEETASIPGSIAEIGVASGSTTVFLNKYLDAQGIEKMYYAIDTFSGFVEEDVEYEAVNRGKDRSLFSAFRANKKKWFDGVMKLNNINRVNSIESDVNLLDLKALAPLSFVLLDVDLYRPIRNCLPPLYDALSPGGIIVVDDCDPAHLRWDGADQAYKEFMESQGLCIEVVHGKLGLINKPE